MKDPLCAKNALNMKLFVVTLTAENKTKVIGLYTSYEQAMRDLVLALVRTNRLSFTLNTSLETFGELMVRECVDEEALIENIATYGDSDYQRTWSFEITPCYSINKIFN
jgi:hypothetical protein